MSSREAVPNLTVVPDGACQNFGCRSTWGLGNQLFVFSGIRPPAKDEESGLDIFPSIHHMRWDTDMHKPIARKLVNETHGIFLKLQNMEDTEKNSNKKANILKISREYRAVIKACELEMKALQRNCHDETESEELQSEFCLLSIIELVWNLAEILFVQTLPGGAVLQQLLEWFCIHFTDGDTFSKQAMQEESPEHHPNYWNAIYIFVLQGRIDEARKLLSMHSHRTTEPYVIMEQLLKRMPTFSSYMGHSMNEFDLRWRHWQGECTQRLEQGDFATDANLMTICKILCGEDEVFMELHELLGEWYCMLLSRLLYQQPTIKPFDIHYHASFCIDAYGGHGAMQMWDNIILAALEYDIHQVIQLTSAPMSNWWFSAHLTDLLHHCGKLETQSMEYGSDLREFLILEYAISLLSHDSMWQTGVDYLDHCQQYGRAYMEHFIERIPLDTEKKAHNIIRVCEQRDMQDQIRSICKVMGMKALHNGQLGSALSWGLQSKDVNFATFLAEKFLHEFSDTGDFSHLDLLDNLGPAMLISPKLTFLGKYREFHKLYEEGEFKAAATLLLSLLTAKIAPPKFWPTLLSDALPMLEAKEVIIFNHQQTCELLRCLQEINIARKLERKSNKEKIDPRREEIENEKLDLMKLALARNLSRAIYSEGTVPA